MKESWLEKLIELFRDYVENYWNDTKDPTIDNVVIYDWQWFYFGARFYSDEKVLSKKFWFIQWLADKNLIDCEKYIFTVDWNYDRDAVIYEIERQNYYILNEQYWVDFTDCILMLLSISDTPIDDLISYLK